MGVKVVIKKINKNIIGKCFTCRSRVETELLSQVYQGADPVFSPVLANVQCSKTVINITVQRVRQDVCFLGYH